MALMYLPERQHLFSSLRSFKNYVTYGDLIYLILFAIPTLFLILLVVIVSLLSSINFNKKVFK